MNAGGDGRDSQDRDALTLEVELFVFLSSDTMERSRARASSAQDGGPGNLLPTFILPSRRSTLKKRTSHAQRES